MSKPISIRRFDAMGQIFQLQLLHEGYPTFARTGVHEVLCGAVEVCWMHYPVDLIYSIAEDRDMSVYSEIAILFRSHDPDLLDDVQLYDLDRTAAMNLADYRAFIRSFVPAALPISRFGISDFEREIPTHIRAHYVREME